MVPAPGVTGPSKCLTTGGAWSVTLGGGGGVPAQHPLWAQLRCRQTSPQTRPVSVLGTGVSLWPSPDQRGSPPPLPHS